MAATPGTLPLLAFVLRNYKNFNARATRDALIAYWDHIDAGGKMFWTLAGAMSSAQLGITLAPAIRAGLVHGLSVTGANLEESLFRLVAHDEYRDFPDYRYLTKQDDTRILENRMRRVTDTSIPEDEAFRAVEKHIVPMWEGATARGERRFWHEYFYELIRTIESSIHTGAPEECWLLAAAEAGLPLVVPGYEDSTFGNIFASYVRRGECNPSAVKSGVEYMAALYDHYRELSAGPGVGFFQIGGGIAGDFPICVVPSLKYDVGEPAKPWAYFCQISDSTTSYGSYSGATPNEKITWDKLTEDTPMFVIESDATIVAPLLLGALLECKANPAEARAMIDASGARKTPRLARGSVVTVAPPSPVGAERSGEYPAMVVRDFGEAVLLVPITHADKKALPTHHKVAQYASGTQTKDALLTCEHAITLHRSRCRPRRAAAPLVDASVRATLLALSRAIGLTPCRAVPSGEPTYRRGQIVHIDWGAGLSPEPSGFGMAVIVSNDTGNYFGRTFLVAPSTGRKAVSPVTLAASPIPSVDLGLVRVVDLKRIVPLAEPIYVATADLLAVDDALRELVS